MDQDEHSGKQVSSIPGPAPLHREAWHRAGACGSPGLVVGTGIRSILGPGITLSAFLFPALVPPVWLGTVHSLHQLSLVNGSL